jgi:hypothetical protein
MSAGAPPKPLLRRDDSENGTYFDPRPHRVLSIGVNEDQLCCGADHKPRNIILPYRFAPSLAKFEVSKVSIRGPLKRAGLGARSS